MLISWHELIHTIVVVATTYIYNHELIKQKHIKLTRAEGDIEFSQGFQQFHLDSCAEDADVPAEVLVQTVKDCQSTRY